MPKEFLKKHFIDDVKGSLRRCGGNAPARLQDKTFTENGVFKADEGYDGLREVTVLVEASGGAGSGDLIELEIMPETVVSYNNDMQAYVLPRPVHWMSRNPYIVVINGKTYMPTTMGVSQGGGTIVGNTGLVGYYGNEYGSFGIMCTHYTGLCTMILDPEYFPVPGSVTVRIYKLLSKIDASGVVNSIDEPYREFAFEDDRIDAIPERGFSSKYVYSAKSQSAEYIGSNAFNTSSLSAIDCPNVRHIGEGALSYCKGLYYANLPLVEEIDNEAFNYCSGLKLLDFHALQYIGSYAFVNCVTLKILIIRSESVCTLSSTDAFSTTPFDSSFSALEPGGILLVPRALIDAYLNETNWSAVMGSGNNSILAIEDFTVDGTTTGELGPNPNKIIAPGLYLEIPELNGMTMTDSWESLVNDGIVCVDNGIVYTESPYDICGTLILPDDGSITALGDASIDVVNGWAMTGRPAFEDCSNMTGILIPSGVTTISDGAFYGCENLTSVTIPDSVTSIGINAFACCYNLTSINIPDGVTSIEAYTFYECCGLTSVIIPDSVTSIGEYAFDCCCSLANINIPEGVASIGEGAFEYCSSLTSITIPEGVTSIGDYAFRNCSGLTDINIPDGVTSIGEGAFEYCSGITSITIPDGVTSIGEGAFRSCSGLTDINIPDGVTSIGEGAFYGCSSLTSIIIPEGVTSIDNNTFDNCSSLDTVIIRSESVCSLASDVFINTPFDSSGSGGILLVRRELIDAYRNDENWSAIINSGNNTIIAIEDITVDGTITGEFGHNPNKIMSAGLYQDLPKFGTMVMTQSWDNLLNNEVISVSEGGVQSLNSSLIDGELILPDDGSITTINKDAFKDCFNLTDITIPESVTSIDESAFRNCFGLTSVNIPEGVTSIGNGAFRSCSNLTSITIPDGVIGIGGNTFYGCSSLTSIIIPEGVTSIGGSTFYGCFSLTSIIIPESVTSIGGSAFTDCSSLTNITIPEGLTGSIGADMFYNCSSLTSIIIPEGITSIEKRGLYKCSSLVSITLPNSLISIGTDAIRYCSALTSITIPAGVTNIDDGAFRNCGLKTVTVLAETPPTISSGMFNNCPNLTAIEVPAVSVDAYKAATYWSDYSSYIVAIA